MHFTDSDSLSASVTLPTVISLVTSPACFLLIKLAGLLSPEEGRQTDGRAEETLSKGSGMSGRDGVVVETLDGRRGRERGEWEMSQDYNPLFGAVTVNVTSVRRCRFRCRPLRVRRVTFLSDWQPDTHPCTRPHIQTHKKAKIKTPHTAVFVPGQFMQVARVTIQSCNLGCCAWMYRWWYPLRPTKPHPWLYIKCCSCWGLVPNGDQ